MARFMVLPGVHLPLMCIFDYKGFRVMAQVPSALPLHALVRAAL